MAQFCETNNTGFVPGIESVPGKIRLKMMDTDHIKVANGMGNDKAKPTKASKHRCPKFPLVG